VSVTAASARVTELQSLLAQAGAPPEPTAAGSQFSAALASASGVKLPDAAVKGIVDDAAQRNGVDPALLEALIGAESGFNPNAVSSAGAQGLGQLMPGTARSLGVTDSFDPQQAADGAARYLRQQLDRFGGDPARALAAYNAGPGAVERFGGVPPYAETQAYVRRVLANADQYRSTIR
jgi:soluble lytic murein transglycosylase-like protein